MLDSLLKKKKGKGKPQEDENPEENSFREAFGKKEDWVYFGFVRVASVWS